MTTFTIKCLALNKFLKILWRFLLVLFLLILAALVFLETPYGQNWLADRVVKKLSNDLHTKITVRHVQFSLFNKLNLEDFMVEDRKSDTLLYAGNLQVNITDWFFFKDKIDLQYIRLENAVIHLNRTDSNWNYQFIVDYFTPGTTTSPKKSGIALDFKKLSLKNVVILQKDPWRGEDMKASVGSLEMDANEVSLSKKNIDIRTLQLAQPVFTIYNYNGKQDELKQNPVTPVSGIVPADSGLQWNAGDWKINIASLRINNGFFGNKKQTESRSPTPFDSHNIEFASINGELKNLRLEKDTFSAHTNLSTKERCGFTVRSLQTDLKIHPKGMSFDNLDLQTNTSTVRRYFSMWYTDMADMGDFIHKVKMAANFQDAYISSEDIAYFVPDAGNWQKNIRISGRVRGTVDDIYGKDLAITAGKDTYINGDLSLTGLPDINQTFIDFKSNDLRTNYSDIARFIPAIKNIKQPDLARLGNIHFKGSFTGFIHDFVAFGTLRTNLGTARMDLNMKLPPGKEPLYSGNIATTDFQLGEFIHNPSLGSISFSGVVKGHGFDVNTLGVNMNANISNIVFNGYRYHNISTNGKLEKSIYDGFISIKDSNLTASMNGVIAINPSRSKFDLVATVEKANLQPLGLTKDDVSFNGKFNLNFTGNTIDDFLGSARITDASLLRNKQRMSFDSLVLTSNYLNGEKTLTARSNEFDGTIAGDFRIKDLPNTIQLFLNKYYPSYIPPPASLPVNQRFTVDIVTRTVDPYIQLVDKNLKGFNDSKISGSIDMGNNSLNLSVSVPQFSYGQYVFSNANIKAIGDLNQLTLTGDVSNVQVNDSLNMPNTHLDIVARNDSSRIKLTTAANQAVTKANLAATVITYNDGVKINFDTSSFVLNGKTWNIDKGGVLQFRRNTQASGELVLRESNQTIKLSTVPSTEGSWNDLLVDLANVNLGDIMPYLAPRERIEGLVSGSAKVENPGDKMSITGDLKTQFLRFNGDSIGQVNVDKITYDNRTGNLKAKVNNTDPIHQIAGDVNIFLKGNHTDNLISIETKNYQLKILESFLGNLFSDITGYATGKLDIKGSFDQLNYVGKAHLHDAGLKVKFTQVYYRIADDDIDLREHELDLGSLQLIDTITKRTATLKGSIQHDSWKNMFFDLEARVDDHPMTLLNTTSQDNSSFYGHAIGTGSMILVGPQSDMALVVDAKASELDSSSITIPPAKSKSGGMAEFLVERTHGHTQQDSIAARPDTKITYDIDITADPHTTVEVVLDEETGDMVKGRGRGSLNIHSGTTEPLTINGGYELDEGNYLFTFQSFFKRPFELRKGGNNFIKWNGDPLKAQINFDAIYTAERVSFAPLASSLVDSKVQTTREDVNVNVIMSGELFAPKFNFKLEFPASSIAISDPVLAFNIQQIQNNPNEIQKQVTYLIVFNSFAPIENSANATAATSSTISNTFNELAYSTISSLFFNELNKQFSNMLAKIFKDDKLRVNVTGAVYNRNLVQQSNPNSFNINTANVNITVSRALFNNRFVITAGSTLDVPLQTSLQQKFQFLPDVTAEWLINPAGTIRATFFYKENLDFFTNATNTTTRNRRTGASIGYRKEFDHIGDLFRSKKKIRKQEEEQKQKNQTTETPPADLPKTGNDLD